LALWLPGWPVTAWALAEGEDAELPVAVIAANRVVACSKAAVAEGVVVGQRRREAQSRCPELKVIPADETRDAREFEPVIECVEQLSPGVQLIRPGLCVVRAQGLSGYLGDEVLAAETVLEAVVVELGIDSGLVGVADGVFAAIQAARCGDPVRVVLPGESATFLAPLPVSRLADPELSGLLPRLGINTLGAFAAVDAARVRDRFGRQGLRLHALASGRDPRRVSPRTAPPELIAKIGFEPPLTLVDQVAFAARATVERFIEQLAVAGLACTEVRLEFAGERDEFCARTWLTPAIFDASAVLDRVRWQLQAAAGKQIFSGICSLQLEPVAVDALANHAPGLFGLGPDQRVHHAMSRVQAMLGHEGVLTPRIGGGRWLAERQVLVPWGDRPVEAISADQPWPGRIPDPLPATVFTEPMRVQVATADGAPVSVNERGGLVGVPASLVATGTRRSVQAWAGPWPVSERAWDAQRQRRANRFQMVDADGTAWLLLLDARGWWAEARYD
jgi:protein ImuB